MADLNDLFGGASTVLTSHTADSGGTWSRISWDSINNVPSTDGSGGINVTDFCSVMVNSDVSTSGDGTLSMSLSDHGNFLTRITLFGRVQSDSTCVGAAIRFDSGSGNWMAQIETRDSSGNATVIGTEDVITWDRYQTGTLNLEFASGVVTLKLGTTTLVSRSGVGITAAGKCGFMSRDMTLHNITWTSATSSSTLTAAQGSFSLTGQAASLKVGRSLSAAQGSYSLTGQNATLTYAQPGVYTLTAEQGSYTITGSAGLAQRAMNAGFGSYSLSGQEASFSLGVPQAYTLTAAQGAYALTGRSARLIWSNSPVVTHAGGYQIAVSVKIGL